MGLLGIGIDGAVQQNGIGNRGIVQGLGFHGAVVIDSRSADVRQDRGSGVLRRNADAQGAGRGVLIGQYQVLQRNGQGAAGGGKIYVIFRKRRKEVRCGQLLGAGFEMQLIAKECIRRNGDDRRFAIFTLQSLDALLSLFIPCSPFSPGSPFSP